MNWDFLQYGCYSLVGLCGWFDMVVVAEECVIWAVPTVGGTCTLDKFKM